MRRPKPGILLVLRRELLWIRRRRIITFMALVFPLALFALLAAVFNTGLPTSLPIAAIDRDQSALSRQILRLIDATPDVNVALYVADLHEGRSLIAAGKAYALVLLPENLERDVKAGRRPDVVVFYNNQFMTIGSIVSRAIGDAVGTAGAGIAVSIRVSHGQPQAIATEQVAPVPVQQSPLFNPGLNYIYFLLAAFIPAILQIFVCATSAYSVGLERHGNAGLARLHRLGGGIGNALIGKTLPYTIAFMVTLGIADAVLFGRLGAPFRGSIPMLILAALLFILAYQLIGILFGLVAKDIAQALGFAGLYTAPSFGFVGISFPRAAMGLFAQAWGAQLPLTWYMQIRIDQTLRGAPESASLPALQNLTLIVLVLFGLVLLRLFLLRRKRHALKAAAREARA